MVFAGCGHFRVVPPEPFGSAVTLQPTSCLVDGRVPEWTVDSFLLDAKLSSVQAILLLWSDINVSVRRLPGGIAHHLFSKICKTINKWINTSQSILRLLKTNFLLEKKPDEKHHQEEASPYQWTQKITGALYLINWIPQPGKNHGWQKNADSSQLIPRVLSTNSDKRNFCRHSGTGDNYIKYWPGGHMYEKP